MSLVRSKERGWRSRLPAGGAAGRATADQLALWPPSMHPSRPSLPPIPPVHPSCAYSRPSLLFPEVMAWQTHMHITCIQYAAMRVYERYYALDSSTTRSHSAHACADGRTAVSGMGQRHTHAPRCGDLGPWSLHPIRYK